MSQLTAVEASPVLVSDEIYGRVDDIINEEVVAGFRMVGVDARFAFYMPAGFDGLLAVRAKISGDLDEAFAISSITVALGTRAHAVSETFPEDDRRLLTEYNELFVRALRSYGDHDHRRCLERYEAYPQAPYNDPTKIFDDLERSSAYDRLQAEFGEQESDTVDPKIFVAPAFQERQEKYALNAAS